MKARANLIYSAPFFSKGKWSNKFSCASNRSAPNQILTNVALMKIFSSLDENYLINLDWTANELAA